MSQEDDRKKKKLIIDAVIVAAIVGIIALAIMLLTYKRETRITDTYANVDKAALSCYSDNNTESGFFYSDAVSKVRHEIKIVYNDGSIDKVSYAYSGEYDSSDAAEHDDAVLHARYNIYMGEHDMNSGSLNPVFISSGNKLTISLYLDGYKKMNSVLGKLFYIGSASMETIGKNSVEETKKHYENKGFSCEIQD